MSIALNKKRKDSLRANLWRHVFAWLLMAFAVFPIIVVISSALSETGALSTGSLLPDKISFNNFVMLFTDGTIPFPIWVLNTFVLAVVNAVLSVLVGMFAAFAFSRLKYRGRKQSLQALFLIQVFPSFLALAAIYVIFENLYKLYPLIGLGSLGGLLLVYLGGSMGGSAWLLKGFLDTIPMELDEAAKIDGASPAQIFWQIFLPLTTPILIVTTLLSFIGTFNEFILASLFLQDINSRTVAVGLQSFVGGTFGANWGPFAAGSLLAAIPLVALFLSLQKYIVSGVTAGSVKG